MRLVRGRVGRRGGPPPARAAHHGGGARRCRKKRAAALHLGPLLTDAERQYLTCDATCEVWFERDGQVNRLRASDPHDQPAAAPRPGAPPTRRAAVPGCGATRGLHAHHIAHWEDGGPTELVNLVLVCPYHHRLHHRGVITITGPAHQLVVTDSAGRTAAARIAGPSTDQAPPDVPPYPGPTGERADWWWYGPLPTPTATHTD